ncbi:MAG TPA: CDP-diacylglycerol--serine O-phosphatidyltransferase [Acidobacteriota bacterium]|nr:CDP-diacylglycerol--serine O-phosphatidyltransferase [Acidobacteriota bacterium]
MSEQEPEDLHHGRRRLGRSVIVLPSMFTVGNIFCGYYAILSTMYGNYHNAAYAIGIAIILDSIDGFIARLTNTSSGFGLQLDSLADVISFGIAPSLLALVWGLSTVDQRLAWIAAFTFAICGATRLARFNVQAGNLKHFVGLPIPAAGGAIAATVHFFRDQIADPLGSNLMLAAMFLLSFLMISTIRYSSLKHFALGKKSHLTVLVMALLVALIFFLSQPTLIAIAAIYVVSGPVARLYAIVRRKKTGHDSTIGDTMQRHL